jgi:hypothetical protein
MRELGARRLVGSMPNGVRNTTIMPPFLARPRLFAQTTTTTSTTQKAADLETPGDYLEQARRAREIWPAYGGDTGKYPDPIVSAVMDMFVSVTVAFGSENLFKDVSLDDPAKKILDHWCASVNRDDPMLTGGLDAVRKQLHRGRWCDGGVVIGWSPPESMETYDGLKYMAPKNVAVYPRTQFSVEASDEYGGMKLIERTDLSDFMDTPSEEIGLDEKRGLMNGMLAQNRYQVVDRNRQESAQKYPIPFLIERGLHGIAARIRVTQRGDYETMARILRALLVITQGSDQWLEAIEWDPVDAVSALDVVKSEITTEGSGYTTVVTAPYSTKAEWVIPDMQGLLSADKFAHDDYERLAALGILEIQNTGQRRRYAFNPKPAIMEIWDAMQEDRRFVEGRLFPILYEANPSVYQNISPAKFYQKPVSIFQTDEDKQILLKIYEYGVLTHGALLEQAQGFGADFEAEIERHKYERDSGMDEMVIPRVTFRQGVENGTSPKPQDDDEDDDDEETETASIRAANTVRTMYDSMREGVRDILQSDQDSRRKRQSLRIFVFASIAAWGALLADRVRSIYVSQLGNSIENAGLLEPYISATQSQLDTFGDALLAGGANGTRGLNTLIGETDIDTPLNEIFRTNRHRIGLFDKEPVRVAVTAARAAKAMTGGMTHAVRHSAFSATTCEECIERHGEIMLIREVFAGGWDHPHGLCYFTYHTDQASAALEAEEMLSIDEINAIVAEMALVEDVVLKGG